MRTDEEKYLRERLNKIEQTLQKYSELLSWGLTGQQEECWTMLDSAIEELVKLRDYFGKLKNFGVI